MTTVKRLLKGLSTIQDLSHDLSVQQLRFLLLVSDQPGININECSEFLELAQSSCTRNADLLGSHGRGGKAGLRLLERRPNPEDRRIQELHITPKGERAVARVLGAD